MRRSNSCTTWHSTGRADDRSRATAPARRDELFSRWRGNAKPGSSRRARRHRTRSQPRTCAPPGKRWRQRPRRVGLSRHRRRAADDGRIAPRGAIDAIVGLLAEAGLMPQRPRALLEGAGGGTVATRKIRRMMEYLHEKDDAAHLDPEPRTGVSRQYPDGGVFDPVAEPLRRKRRRMRPSASATWVSSTGRIAGPRTQSRGAASDGAVSTRASSPSTLSGGPRPRDGIRSGMGGVARRRLPVRCRTAHRGARRICGAADAEVNAELRALRMELEIP